MGQTARSTTKSDTQYRFRLSQELDERVDQAWREGPLSELDRQDFVIYLVRLGIEEHERRERLTAAESVDRSGAHESKDENHASSA